MLLILVLLLLFVGYSLVEYALHLRNLRRIPTRVQINGTRGKSSVTRLIAAGLRAGGIRVAAKTTGTRPMFITGDNAEQPVRRLGKANIAEEMRMVRLAQQHQAQALVIECMALDPQYQDIESRMLVRPTHPVVTNVRPDHLDVMGPTVEDVALAFSWTVPRHGTLFTAERKHLEVLCRKAGSDLETVVADPLSMTDSEMQGFSYLEHKENVALALSVCEQLGVGRNAALAGMKRCLPDPGALRVHAVNAHGKRFELVNGLAANDPDSIRMLWDMVKSRSRNRTVLVNCRRDRTDRSRQLAELVSEFEADRYVITGGLTRVFLRRARELGIASGKLVDVGEERAVSEVYERVAALVEDSSLVFACGNTVGYGEELIRYFVEQGDCHGFASQ